MTMISSMQTMESGGHASGGMANLTGLLEPMPDKELVVFSGTVKKCPFHSNLSNWRAIFCSLTADKLYMSKDKQDYVCIDYIPLYEVIRTEAAEAQIENNGAQFFPFILCTIANGHNGGRRYQFRVDDEGLRQQWLKIIDDCTEVSRKKHEDESRLTPWQQLKQHAKAMHDSDPFQQFFGGVIITSFLVSLVISVSVSMGTHTLAFLHYVFCSSLCTSSCEGQKVKARI